MDIFFNKITTEEKEPCKIVLVRKFITSWMLPVVAEVPSLIKLHS